MLTFELVLYSSHVSVTRELALTSDVHFRPTPVIPIPCAHTEIQFGTGFVNLINISDTGHCSQSAITMGSAVAMLAGREAFLQEGRESQKL